MCGAIPDGLLDGILDCLVTGTGTWPAASRANASRWGLPKSICEAAQYHENPSASGLDERAPGRELARIVHAASQIADVCVAPNDREAAASAAELVAGCEAVGIDSQALAALFEGVFVQWAEWGRLLDVPTQRLPNLDELIEAGRAFHSAGPTVMPDDPQLAFCEQMQPFPFETDFGPRE